MATPMRVGIVTPAFFYVPFWVGLERGLYARAGLEVEVPVLGGIDPVTAALKTGEIQVGVGSPEHVIHDVEAGGALRMFGGNVNRPTHDIIAQPEIKRLEDLRGRTIGVSAMSGGTSSLFMDILERAGLRYPGDYTIVEAGPVPPRHEKLLAKTIDACMQTDPHNYIAEDAGFSNLGPVMNWIPYFQFNSINMRLDWAQANRDATVKFLAATIEASRWIFDNRDAAVALACARMGVERRYAERAWDDHLGNAALPVDLHLGRGSIETAADMIRRDRFSQVAISAETDAAKYVEVGMLEEAQRLAGVPAQAIA